MRITEIRSLIDGKWRTVRSYGNPGDGMTFRWVTPSELNVRTWPKTTTMFVLSNGEEYLGRDLLRILKHLRYEFTIVNSGGYGVACHRPGESGNVVMSYPDILSAWRTMDTLSDVEFEMARRQAENES